MFEVRKVSQIKVYTNPGTLCHRKTQSYQKCHVNKRGILYKWLGQPRSALLNATLFCLYFKALSMTLYEVIVFNFRISAQQNVLRF